MRRPKRSAGYTLIEIIVALLILTVGLLALAASSALIARAMAKNALRERGARIAVSRIEVLKSQCAIATSGNEIVQQVESDWSVIREPARFGVVESIHCLSSPASCADSYRATMWCRP